MTDPQQIVSFHAGKAMTREINVLASQWDVSRGTVAKRLAALAVFRHGFDDRQIRGLAL